jgi:hypothetical protein
MNLKAEFESGSSQFSFKTLNSRQFQRGVGRVNLHRLTRRRARVYTPRLAATQGPPDIVLQGLGFRVQGLGVRVQGLGFGGLGF